jgi:cytochrome P450 family 142 subfamily A polypeptide 1
MIDVNVEFMASESWDDKMMARLRWLRENDPVHWSEKDGVWVVTKFEDVVRISKDQDLFTSEHGVRPGNAVKIGLIDEAEPRHTQLRNLINRGFTPRMVKKLELVFREITTRAIDEVAPLGECDFVEAISVPLPLRMIAAMIGIKDEDYDRFHAWSDAMIAAEGSMSDPVLLGRAGQAYLEYATYITEVIEDRRKQPQDDLVSILANADSEGMLREYDESETFANIENRNHAFENSELIKMMVILLVAGNETTRNALSGGMELLIEHPEERRKLVQNPALTRGAVEEIVRMVSPVNSFGRTLTSDTELRGRKLEAGQQVLMIYPSANRDADVFEDPDRFDVERNPQHLGFGIGSHFCLGANLARMELRVAIEEVLRRMPDIEYAGNGAVLRPSALVRSCIHMPVRFTPEERRRSA